MVAEQHPLAKSLSTPCLLLNKQLMEQSYSRLYNRVRGLGVSLRTHVKTIKSTAVAKALFSEPSSPITVSTLKEAEEFAAAGYYDMVYAVGISPGKLPRVHKVRQGGVKLQVILDSAEQAECISRYVQQTNDPIQVLIEVDCDDRRAGVKANDKDTIIQIAKILTAGGATLEGVLTHSGGSYASKSVAEITAMAERERLAVVSAAQTLREQGFKAPTVSLGSTPTACFASSFSGVTEVRAGVFVFLDLVMAGLGVCSPSDIAISVLTTVIGHQPEKGWIIVDAGWMAMSSDRGTAHQQVDQGYGLACNEHGEVIDGLTMVSATQEHGVLAFRDGKKDVQQFPVGSLLRILPNHACATAAQYQEYHVVENGAITAIWPRFNGW